jgi:hypothetical protein
MLTEQVTGAVMTAEDGAATTVCPACGGGSWVAAYRADAVPVTTASTFPSAAEALAVPTGALDLRACNRCGLVYNAAFDAGLAMIGASYESSQGASAHFGAYARGLAADWVSRFGLTGRTVLEIGCGDGEFLVEMLAAGCGRGIGLDPLARRTPVLEQVGARVELIAATFEDAHLNLQADAVVCRHTLEHIPNVAGFLSRLACWAARGEQRLVLLEVPASERIFAEGAFWDVYYEHCNYFTAASLGDAFARAGFVVTRLTRAYGEQYVLLEAVAGRRQATAPRIDKRVSETAHAFGARARRAVETAAQGIANLASEGPVVLWQGAAKAVGFLAALPRPCPVRHAVDLNRGRHGLYLPGSAVQVIAPEQLPALRPVHVVLMNPAYGAEVATRLRELGSPARLWTVNELCASPSAYT